MVLSQRAGGDPTFFARRPAPSSAVGFKAGDPQFRIDFTARDQSGRSFLVGIAPSQLGSSYPHLAWMLAVTQAEDELFAPVRAQMWRMLGVFGVIAAAVLAIAVSVSLRLAAPPSGKTSTSPNTRRCPGSKKSPRSAGRRWRIAPIQRNVPARGR